MPAPLHYLAIDLGASHGRAVLGSLGRDHLQLEELHQFPNGPITLPTGLHWDTPRLLAEIKHGISLAQRSFAASRGGRLSGIGIATWGVDYGLLNGEGKLLSLPHHYRDPRTRGLMDEVFAVIPRAELYSRTGIQFMPLNTLYQLRADRASGRLSAAAQLLFTPDLLNFWLTGIARTEPCIASTSQMLDPAITSWCGDILAALELPASILPNIAPPASEIGPLLPDVAAETGAGPVPVIAPGSHDTASAVAATPGRGDRWAYISCGTWSLLGRELAGPIRTAAAMEAGFTNECGIAGTVRFHRNITGLWLLQECQRTWDEQGLPHDLDTLLPLARAAPALSCLIDPDHASFAEFGDMPARIRSYCQSTGQQPPKTPGAITRCVLESLALKHRQVLESLEDVTGRPIDRLHIVGGGARNELLCQWTADATGREVLAGPAEATAAGNVLAQAMASGNLGSLSEIREVVARSFSPARYEPSDRSAWADAIGEFRSLPA